MRALIYKELRENLKWALLGMVGLGIALCYALFQTPNGSPDYYHSDGVTLLKKSFLMVTTFGCPLVGLGLALLQILPELPRDRWAALLHRPTPRTHILGGKVLAGLILYSLATIPPFALSVWFVATPGYFAVPFLPEMVRPGLADIATGVVYYMAGLVMALHRGGWPIVRAFPLLAALHVSFFVQGTALFYVAIEAAAAMVIALFLAAWGAIISPELLRTRPLLNRLAFLVVVFYGTAGLGGLALSLLDAVAPKPVSTRMAYQLTKEGLPLRITYVDNVVTAVETFDGQPVTDPKLAPNRVRNSLQYLNVFTYYTGDSHGWKPWPAQQDYRESYTYMYANNPYQYPRFEQWFNVKRPRILVGFLPAQKKEFARLGQDGFHPAGHPVEPFAEDVELGSINQNTYYIANPTSLKFADLGTQQIRDAQSLLPEKIYGVGSAYAQTEKGSVRVIGAAMDTGMVLYDEKGDHLTTLPYRQDMSQWGRVYLGINAARDQFFLLYGPSVWLDEPTKQKMPSFLDIVNIRGETLQSFTLPALPVFPKTASWASYLRERVQSPAFIFGTMIYQKVGGMMGSTRLAGSYAWYFKQGRAYMQNILTWCLTGSVILSGLVIFWARRAQMSWQRSLLWGAVVLGFNLAGLVVFRLAADWPRLVACPQCHRRRRTDQLACPSCSVSWSPAPANGSEIFDARQTAADLIQAQPSLL